MATLVLTVIGDDRPGLVSSLSGSLASHGALWERSRMARLAGKFAGVLEVAVPDDRAPALLDDLRRLGAEGLTVTAEQTDAPDPGPATRLSLALVGADRPGIVAEISGLLADRGVSVEELATSVTEAPMAGTPVFEAQAVLVAPAGLDADDLRRSLESVADELMVEMSLHE